MLRSRAAGCTLSFVSWWLSSQGHLALTSSRDKFVLLSHARMPRLLLNNDDLNVVSK